MNLPPLPKLPMQFDHIHTLESNGDVEDVPVYTETQLRTCAEQYGRLCAEAEREACALACDELWDAEDRNRQVAYGMELCASAIRARSQR